MTVRHNTSLIIERLQVTGKRLAPNSPHMKEAMTRIGMQISSIAKLNVKRQNLIDTGRLLNSIRYEFFRDGEVNGVRIGSFNVPYAAIHEFGYRGLQTVPGHVRTITQAFGRPIDPRKVSIAAFTRTVNVTARPYLIPAVNASRTFIVDTLRAALSYKE